MPRVSPGAPGPQGLPAALSPLVRYSTGLGLRRLWQLGSMLERFPRRAGGGARDRYRADECVAVSQRWRSIPTTWCFIDETLALRRGGLWAATDMGAAMGAPPAACGY